MAIVKSKQLLTVGDAKTSKGELLGYKTHILYMIPYTQNSKKINLCPHASAGCAAACLVGSGKGGVFSNVIQGRQNKTEYFLAERVEFLNQLVTEITKAIKKQKGKDTPVFRLNGTADIRYEKFKIFEGKNIFELFPEVQFYDYTKNYLRFDQNLPKNYDLTFSRSETNHDKAMEILKKGYNVAMVFDEVPTEYEGYEVINGDEHDLRFLDKKGVIVGLKYKKLTAKGSDNNAAFDSGFAIRTKNQ